MSYLERLNSFDQARAATQEHVENIRKSLSNKEFEENPVKAGLETAGSVLGTGEGLLRLKREMGERGTLRNTAKAIYNRLKNPSQLRQDLGDTLKGQVDQRLRNTGTSQSSGSGVADNGRPAPRSVKNTIDGGSDTPSGGQAPTSVRDPVDESVANFPQTGEATKEANQINRSINQKVKSNLSSDEIGDLNTRLSNRPNLDNINALSEGDAKVASQKEYLDFKNRVANDAVARKQTGQSAADTYDARGNPQSATSQTASADADGGASAGSSARATQVGDGTDTSLPNSASATDVQRAGASAGDKVTGVAEDATNAAKSSVAASTEDGASIVARGQALSTAAVPSQSGLGSVQGLTSAPTADSASGASHIVSQAQSGNAVAHQTGEAPGSQTTASARPDGGDAQAGNSAESAQQRALQNAGAEVNDASKGASTADEASTAAKGAGSGIQKALGVEEGLDELAPESGVLAPILEAGSLLATLGTSIASLFEPSQKAKPQAPKPPPQTLSVGANLKKDAQGAVGAF
jgi:hypothetical protein